MKKALVVGVIVVVLIGTYVFLSKNKPSVFAEGLIVPEQEEAYFANWLTYKNVEYKLEFKYPPDWKLDGELTQSSPVAVSDRSDHTGNIFSVQFSRCSVGLDTKEADFENWSENWGFGFFKHFCLTNKLYVGMRANNEEDKLMLDKIRDSIKVEKLTYSTLKIKIFYGDESNYWSKGLSNYDGPIFTDPQFENTIELYRDGHYEISDAYPPDGIIEYKNMPIGDYTAKVYFHDVEKGDFNIKHDQSEQVHNIYLNNHEKILPLILVPLVILVVFVVMCKRRGSENKATFEKIMDKVKSR